jgi:uncharacterized protein YutE (UPF0331/DUF86 family)
MSPGRLDRDVVRRHLAALDAALGNLRRHAGRTVELLSSDPDERWAVERGLQLCAQNALDIAIHIAAGLGRDAPDYGSAIARLGELAVVPSDFATRFRSVAGFRNVLVHGYLAVDLALVHAVLNRNLDDFAEFARHIETYLDRG